MDLRRLKHVRDVCPLSSEVFHWRFATKWMGEVARGEITFVPNGYSMFVARNKILTWRRTFTSDNAVPAPFESTSLITIDEWAPTIWPRAIKNWKRFGMIHREAIVFLREVDAKNPTKNWSSQVRRHLQSFKKNSDISVRLGTVSEYEKNLANSQVPKRLHQIFINELEAHIKAHPETVEILIAQLAGEVVACFAVGNMDLEKQSYYIAGFFKKGTEKLHAKIGLIEWWFKRSIERGYRELNFGHIVGPPLLPFFNSDQTGYSNFKTHFGVTRVWWPGSFWKLTWKK